MAPERYETEIQDSRGEDIHTALSLVYGKRAQTEMHDASIMDFAQHCQKRSYKRPGGLLAHHIFGCQHLVQGLDISKLVNDIGNFLEKPVVHGNGYNIPAHFLDLFRFLHPVAQGYIVENLVIGKKSYLNDLLCFKIHPGVYRSPPAGDESALYQVLLPDFIVKLNLFPIAAHANVAILYKLLIALNRSSWMKIEITPVFHINQSPQPFPYFASHFSKTRSVQSCFLLSNFPDKC